MTEQRVKRTLMNDTVRSFWTQSSGYVAAVITGVIVARSLGPEGKGIASYAALLLAVFTTYGSGLQSAVLYQCGTKGVVAERAYAAALRSIGAIFLPLSVILLGYGLRNPEHAACIFVACALPFAIYTQAAGALFLLNDDVPATLIQLSFGTFGYAMLVIPALVIWHVSVNVVLAIWALTFAGAAIFSFVWIGRYLAPLSMRTSGQTLREQIGFAAKSGSISLADFLNLRVDVFVVSMMLHARSLGIYSLAVATGEMMWQLSRPLVWSTVGRIAKAERDSAIALTAKVTRNILVLEIAAGIVLFFIAPRVVTLVYGPAFRESGEIIRWLLPGVVIYAAHGMLGYFIMVKEGRPLTVFSIQVGSVIACAAITYTTIGRYGLIGAALATSVTYIVAALLKAAFFLRLTQSSPASIMVLRREDITRYGTLAARLVGR